MQLRNRLVTLALSSVIAALACTPALAVTVIYDTVGSGFTAPASNISYTATASADSVLPGIPAVDSLGTFTVTPGNVTAHNVPFTLMINELAPVAGSASLSGLLSGTITNPPPGGSFLLTFTSPSVTIGTETYTLTNVVPGHPNELAIGPHNFTQLMATISTTTPEPTFFLLTGSGLAGLLAMAIRRRKRSV